MALSGSLLAWGLVSARTAWATRDHRAQARTVLPALAGAAARRPRAGPHRGAHRRAVRQGAVVVHRSGRAGQRARASASSWTPSGTPCTGNHVAATEDLAGRSPPARCPSPTSCCGRRTPPTSTRRRPEGARRGRPRRWPPTASRCWSAPCSTARAANHVSNAGLVWDPVTGPGRDLRQAAPGALRRVHPVPQRARRPGRRRLRQIPYDFAPGNGSGRAARRAGRLGDVICFEVAYDGLVRRQRRGRRAGAGRPDQQRDVRHRTRPASSSRWPGCAPSSTGGPWSSPRPAASAPSSRPTVESSPARRSSPGRFSSTGCRCVTSLTLADRLGAGPEWVLALVGCVGRALAGAGPASEEAQTRDPQQPSRQRDADGSRSIAALGRVLVIIPTYNETREPRADRRPAARRGARGRRAGRRRRQPRRHRRDRRRARRRRRPGPRPAPRRQGRARRRLRRRLRLGARRAATTSLVEMDADGSHQPEQLPRLLDALRRRRPRARLPLGAGRRGRQLAEPSAGALARRQHLRAAGARRAAARHHRRLPRLPPRRPRGHRLTTVASQGYCFQVDLAWRAGGPASASSRSRSRSSSGPAAESKMAARS